MFVSFKTKINTNGDFFIRFICFLKVKCMINAKSIDLPLILKLSKGIWRKHFSGINMPPNYPNMNKLKVEYLIIFLW